MIFQDMQKAREAHRAAIDKQEEQANEVAEAEYEYNVISGATTAALKDAGEPATLIKTLVKGTEEVAAAKRRLTIAEGVKGVCIARTQATYLDWKLAADQYAREWQALK